MEQLITLSHPSLSHHHSIAALPPALGDLVSVMGGPAALHSMAVGPTAPPWEGHVHPQPSRRGGLGLSIGLSFLVWGMQFPGISLPTRSTLPKTPTSPAVGPLEMFPQADHLFSISTTADSNKNPAVSPEMSQCCEGTRYRCQDSRSQY